jgi:hypothetical protein
MTSTNPGELALATIGVSAIIDGEIPRMGIERQRAAYSIPGKLPRLAADVLDDTIKRPPMPRPHSYRKLLDHFAKGLQPHQIQSLVEAFPHDASAMSGAFLITAQQALQHLQQLFPMSVYSTFTGPTNLTPDDVSVWRFFSQLEVLDDPMRVFPLMACGAILRSQVLAMREIYPTLSEAIDGALYETIAKKSATGPQTGPKKFRLPPRAELGVAQWLGRRIMSHVQPAEKTQDSGQPAANSAKPANALNTGNQRAVNNA